MILSVEEVFAQHSTARRLIVKKHASQDVARRASYFTEEHSLGREHVVCRLDEARTRMTVNDQAASGTAKCGSEQFH
jgi:hypothetical protein